ncbi:hypothetical protein C7M51_02251 [Mixta intestinalis]|uniref:Uncharacterized protein n=1 Tax=Mixta intestinalis TaxID=1615494 RepID=A0A6P1Q0W7_9GAMM|nr:hypothetical protein C7M51_02251 [Mixta intestinalis]
MQNRQDENLRQVRVERRRDNVASGNDPKGEAKPSHPARSIIHLINDSHFEILITLTTSLLIPDYQLARK